MIGAFESPTLILDRRSPLPRRLFEVRESPVHGRGVFATHEIPRGTTVIEYTGERITWAEADRREELKDESDTHTMLFTVDKKTVIDASQRGSDARFINHSCWGNCRTFVDERRVYIEARRKILPGEELSYDYKLSMDGEKITKKLQKAYRCLCGSPRCRGTLLYVAPVKPKPSVESKAAPKPKAKANRKAAKPPAEPKALEKPAKKKAA